MRIIKQWFLKYKTDIILLIVLALVSTWSSLALLRSGFIPTHDGEYHIIRFWQFYKMLASGIWFPRWAPDLNSGYGIPLFNFVYPLPNYVASFFHLIGFSFTDSLKMVLWSGFILSGFSFYLFLRVFFKSLSSFLGSVFYLLAPYHLVDVYIRGSVGEVWALAIAPFVLYFGLTKKYALYAIGLALLILSHNILGLMFFVFIILFLIFRHLSLRAPKGRGNLKKIASSSGFAGLLAMTIVGVGLSAFFWLPALVEKKYVVGLEQVNFSDHFPQIWQLIFPSWGTGFSGTGDLSNQMSFQIGIPHLIVIIIAMLLSIKTVILGRSEATTPESKNNGFWISQNDEIKKITVFMLVTLILVLFLMNSISLPIWKIVPLLSFFQFPWRFLSLVIFIISFLTALVAQISNSKKLAVLLFLLALVFYWSYTKPVVYQNRTDDYYLNNPAWTKGTDSPGNSFNTIWFRSPQENSNNLTEAKVNIAYFPGWQVYIDQKPQKTYSNKDGLISFSLPKGQHMMEIKFEDTEIRKWAKYLSLLSLLLAFLVIPAKA